MNIGQGPWFLDDKLMFSVTTHNVTTGASASATGNVAFEVYDHEGAFIEGGNMSDYGSGLYVRTIDLTFLNDYQVGFSYVIVVAATVAGITSRVSAGFRISEAQLPADVRQINSATVLGDGDTIPWGPATVLVRRGLIVLTDG